MGGCVVLANFGGGHCAFEFIVWLYDTEISADGEVFYRGDFYGDCVDGDLGVADLFEVDVVLEDADAGFTAGEVEFY